MITPFSLCNPASAVLRDIETKALEAQAKGQQFICLTSVENYLANKAECDKTLLALGYAVKLNILGWGSYKVILEDLPECSPQPKPDAQAQ